MYPNKWRSWGKNWIPISCTYNTMTYMYTKNNYFKKIKIVCVMCLQCIYIIYVIVQLGILFILFNLMHYFSQYDDFFNDYIYLKRYMYKPKTAVYP